MSRRPSAGARAVRLINQLTHTKGPFAGRPFALRPWQVRMVRQLFATGADGRRVHRTALWMLPRKNGKTELAAALAIYFLLLDGEAGAEVYSAAGDREQASLVFHVAAQMVRQDSELEAQVEIIESQRRMVHRASASVYRAISAEAYSKHGFNASAVIYDELHVAADRELWDVLTSSQGARAQPMTLAISTAGYDRHSILYELYAHAKRVVERPEIDPSFCAVLYELDAAADWTLEANWKKANPALGDFRSLEEMRDKCQRAREVPAQENAFRRLYLNQWTEQAARWISLTAWDACLPSPARADLAGRPAYVGLDLSATTDLTAAVAVLPDPAGGAVDVVAGFWAPAETIKARAKRDHVPYDTWTRDGWLTSTPGPTVDYDAVRRDLNAWAALYDLREIAYDPWNATDLIRRLAQEDGLPCVPMRQGFASLSAPTKSVERAILGGTLRHDRHPILRWCMGNAAAESDAAGNLKLSKRHSTERIDGAAALVMAIDRLDRAAAPVVPQYTMLILGGSHA